MTWAQLDALLPEAEKPAAPKGRVSGAAVFARPR